MSHLFVRLKRYDPQHGCTCKKYVLARFNLTLREGEGWARVPTSLGEYCRMLKQDPNDPHSPALCDVCTEEESKKLERLELDEKRRLAMAAGVASDFMELTEAQRLEIQMAELERRAMSDMNIDVSDDGDDFDDDDEVDQIVHTHTVSFATDAIQPDTVHDMPSIDDDVLNFKQQEEASTVETGIERELDTIRATNKKTKATKRSGK